MSVSCSVIGEGPGTGGSGEDGGRDGGGFPGAELFGDGLIGDGLRGVNGEEGMWEGGAGKDESNRGTALRRSRKLERDSVVDVEVIVIGRTITNAVMQVDGREGKQN